MALSMKTEFFLVGQEIIHRDRPLRIIRKVGEGFTGVVYEAEYFQDDTPLHVAVKVMKPLDIPEAVSKFREEGETLSLLMGFEEKANKLQRLNLKIAPMYYGLGSYEGVNYLVMEFIRGQELPELLLKQEKGHLSEKDALTIGWQFFRTLDILHTELKKTFIDMKFENLWWVSNAQGESQLKMTDFGTLAEIKEGTQTFGGVARDLLLGSIIFFNLLTGYPLQYSIYGLKERTVPLIKRYPLSWGTSQILLRTLHRNPERRFSSAKEIVQELRPLIDFWGKADDEVYRIANTNLDEAYKSADLSTPAVLGYARRALAAISIIETRAPAYNPSGISKAKEDAQKILAHGDHLRVGRDLFMGGSWQEAYAQFQQGKDWSETPTLFRRWGYLATAMMNHNIPREQFEEIRSKAVQTLDWMEKEHWTAALENWKILEPYLNTGGVQALINDCLLFVAMENAEVNNRNGKFSVSAEFYRHALIALEKLPDASFVRQEETGDLRLKAQEMEYEANQCEHAGQLLEALPSLLQTGNTSQIKMHLRDAMQICSEHHAFIPRLREVVRASLEKGDYLEALAFFDLGRQVPGMGEQLREEYSALLFLWQVQQAVKTGLLGRSLTEIEQLLGVSLNMSLVMPTTSKFLRQIETEALATEAVETLKRLLTVLERLPGNHTEWRKAVSEHIHSLEMREGEKEKLTGLERERKAAELMRQAIMFLHPERADATLSIASEYAILLSEKARNDRTKSIYEAKTRLQSAWELAKSSELREEIKKWANQTNQALSANQLAVQANKASENEEASLKTRILRRWNWINDESDEPSLVDIHPVSADLLINEFLEAHEYMLKFNGKDDEIGTIYQAVSARITRRLGGVAWTEIIRIAQYENERMINEFASAQKALLQGDWQHALSSIERLKQTYSPKTDELKRILEQWFQVKEFLDWEQSNQTALQGQEKDAKLLQRIREFLKQSVLDQYWSTSQALRYLENLYVNARNEAQKDIKQFSRANYALKLRNWIEAEQLWRSATQRRG